MVVSSESTGQVPSERGPTYIACDSGESLVLAPRVGGFVDLDAAVCVTGLARELWERLSAGASPEELTRWVVSEFAVDEARADRDVRSFLADLTGRGLGVVAREVEGGSQGPVPEVPADPGALVGRVLPAEAVVQLARSILAGGDHFLFRASGLSMRPQVPCGSVLEVTPRDFADLRTGDIALYSGGEHRLVAHRVVARKADRRLARGDSAARLDLIRPEDFLGVVVARVSREQGEPHRIRLDGRVSRYKGLLVGYWHRVQTALTHGLLVAPIRRVPALRVTLRGSLSLSSKVLRAVERRLTSARRRVDIGRSALLTSGDKDEDRRRLYESKSVQSFTGLDENLDAGLTLIEEVLLNRHKDTPGRALVLGCGPGRECVALARRGFEVTGLDREPGMLIMARELALREEVEARFVVGEADTFDLEGETFSTIFVFSGLYNMLLPRSRRVDLLRASYRHLAPGGRVMLTFLSDYVTPGSAMPPRVRSLWGAINPEHQEGDRYLLNEAVHIFPHPDLLVSEARDAGFEVDTLFRDQRAYDRATRQVRGYAVLRRGR